MLFRSLCLLLLPLSAATAPPSFRGLVSLAGGTVVWASGTEGIVQRSVDGGRSWRPCTQPPDSDQLDFRGLLAWSSRHAIAMSAGAGALSRLYETTDGCRSWRVAFTNPDPQGFWDAVVFNASQPGSGVLLGDPVNGRFVIFRTTDAGRHWIRDLSPELASRPEGEGAFAASNSALAVNAANGDILFGTGGRSGARIFRFSSSSHSWSSVRLPIATPTESSGIFSLACRARYCVAVGGDYRNPDSRTSVAFRSSDAGLSWTEPLASPGGYRSAVAWDFSSRQWLAAGPGGLDRSLDDGRTWTTLSSPGNWNVLSMPWAAGPKGHLGRLILTR